MARNKSLLFPLHPIPPITFRPWIFFAIFLISLVLLSYVPFSVQPRLWICLFGLLLPFGIGIRLAWENRPARPGLPAGQGLSAPPLWPVVFFLVLLVTTRFYRLTELPFWPVADEDLYVALARGLDAQWTNDLLFGQVRSEPVFIWLAAFYFKFLASPSFFAIRLLPAVISILTVLLAYVTARQYWGKGLAFVFTGLFGFSFWSMTLSRFFLKESLAPALQLACLGWLALYLGAPKKMTRWVAFLLLCAFSSLGFYACTTWPAVWAFTGVVIVLDAGWKRRKTWSFAPLFFLITLALAAPILHARLTSSGLSHIREHFGGWFPWRSALDYISAIFWESKNVPPFQTDWGGYLDPVLGALVLVGFLHFLRTFPPFHLVCGALGLGLALLPAVLSNSMEIYRLNHAFPFLLASAALGLRELSSSFLPKRQWTWIVCALLLVTSVDLHKYFGFFCYVETSPSPTESHYINLKYFQIYKVLEQRREGTGPLYVFSEFNLDYINKILDSAVYPFDALQNPGLKDKPPAWAALLTWSDLEPFLKKRFPGLEYVRLPENVPLSLGLFLIPVREIPSPVLDSWIQADEVYRALDRKITNKDPGLDWSHFTEDISPLKDRFKEDPFLRDIYWEKIAFLRGVGGDYAGAAQAYQMALREGYPSGHLNYNWGLARDLSERKTPLRR